MYRLVITVILLFPALAYALDQQQTQSLFNAETLKCTFTVGYTASYEDGQLSSPEKNKDPFKEPIVIDAIDTNKNTAVMIGNLGKESLGVIKSEDSLHFLELTASKNMVATTVFAATEKNSRRYIAVMSRHLGMPDPIISQNFGYCEILQEHY